MSSRSISQFRRRLIASLSALAVVGLGLAATTAPAQATSSNDAVSFTASVDGGTAYAGLLTTAHFTVANVAGVDDFHKLTIVLPPGISAPPGQSAPTALGVTGAGNWSETVTGCGTVPNCSWLVIAKAMLPRSSSRVRPGANLVVSVGFVPNAAGTLTFNAIHVEDDEFHVLSSASITVQNLLAGTFCAQNTGTSPVNAGESRTFTVQAIQAGTDKGPNGVCGGNPVGFSGYGAVRIHLTTDDTSYGSTPRIVPVAPVAGSGDGSASLVTQTSLSDSIFSLSSSTTGKYTFTATFYKAADAQSFDVAENAPGTISGNSGPFQVLAGPAVGVTLVNIDDATNPSVATTSLTAGSQFDSNFFVSDTYGNVTSAPIGAVTVNVGGTGKFTPLAPSSATTPSTPGIVSGSYDTAGTNIPVTLSLGSAPSNAINVNFAGAAVGSGVFVPGGAGTIITSNYTPPNSSGAPTCSLCLNVGLPNGANGPVNLGFDPCPANGNVGICTPGTTTPLVANVSANFKAADGTTPLYTAAAPATLTYVCSSALCPWTNDDGTAGITNDWEEQVEAYQAYTPQAQYSNSTTFTPVPPCLPLGETDPGKATSVPSAPGDINGSCVDVHSLVRNATGDLSFTILYYDDYKMVP